MGAKQIVFIAVAVGAAVAAGILAKGVIGAKPEKEIVQTEPVKKTEVLVADKDIVMGQKLTASSLRWQSWPEEVVVSQMITRDSQPDALQTMESARARENIYQGEPIMDKKILLSDGQGFMSSMIPQNMRAISIKISEQSSAGGFILPGDRVDIISTYKRPAEPGQSVDKNISEVVLSNVRILAINQTIKTSDDGISIIEVKTATIEVEPEQMLFVEAAQAGSEISLALRSLAENDNADLNKIGPQLGAANKKKNDTLFIRYGVGSYAPAK